MRRKKTRAVVAHLLSQVGGQAELLPLDLHRAPAIEGPDRWADESFSALHRRLLPVGASHGLYIARIRKGRAGLKGLFPHEKPGPWQALAGFSCRPPADSREAPPGRFVRGIEQAHSGQSQMKAAAPRRCCRPRPSAPAEAALRGPTPTPTMAPVMVCVVETGMPSAVARNSVMRATGLGTEAAHGLSW